MDTPGHYTSKPLTSQHLHSSFDKLHKSHFITSYIHAQSVHAGDYAVEGRTFSSSWVTGRQTPDNGSPHPPPEQSHGFETPVLKPRVSNPLKSLVVETIAPVSEQREREVTRQPPERPTTKAAPEHPRKKVTSKTRQSAQHTTESTRQTTSKRAGNHMAHMTVVDPDGDSEQVTRLAARRDRKRAKRAIVNPADPPENDCDDEHAIPEGKKKKKKQEKKPKIPAAFALMHGFSAANIGKNRLTLTTPGVFNKGKASAKTHVIDIKKKKGGHNDSFSEYVFLNSVKAKPPKRKRQSTSSSASESGPVYLSAASIVDTDSTSPKDQKSAKTIEVRSNAGSLAVGQQGKATVESEVWDIELENSSPVPAPISKDGTVVVNTSGIRWCAGANVVAGNVGMPQSVVGEDKEQPDIFPEKCTRGGVDIHSSPSLGPSQSASQSGRRGHLGSNLPVVTGFSRYFPQLTAGQLACKHSNPMFTPEDSTPAVYTTQRHFSTLNSPPDKLELVSAQPSNICGGSEHYAETLLVPPPVNHFYNSEDRPDIVSSPNSLERAVEEYEAEDHIFRALLRNDELLNPRNNHEPTFHEICHNDILELDQGRCKGWRPGYQEPSECNGSDDHPNHSGNLDWPVAYPYMDMVHDGNPFHGTVDDYATAWELPAQPATRDYGEVEYLSKDEFIVSEESQVEDGQWYEPYNHMGSDGFCLEDFAIQSATRPGTELSLSTRRSDDASSGATSEKGSLLQQFSQGRGILGLSGHHNARYLTPSRFDTVLRAEADVATSLKGHWLPQKL